jgi:hypothetical protein
MLARPTPLAARSAAPRCAALPSGASLGPQAPGAAWDQPKHMRSHARGASVELFLEFDVEQVVRTAMSTASPVSGAAFDFLQLGGTYRVTGHVGARTINFTAHGAAETFRPRVKPLG